MRIAKWALLAWLISGCGPPILYDADRRPVRDPLMMASLEGGWLAVDSAADGLRAVLELQVSAPYGHVGSWVLSGLQLWTGSGLPVEPSRIRQGEVHCWPSIPDAVHCRESNGDPKTVTTCCAPSSTSKTCRPRAIRSSSTLEVR